MKKLKFKFKIFQVTEIVSPEEATLIASPKSPQGFVELQEVPEPVGDIYQVVANI